MINNINGAQQYGWLQITSLPIVLLLLSSIIQCECGFLLSRNTSSVLSECVRTAMVLVLLVEQ